MFRPTPGKFAASAGATIVGAIVILSLVVIVAGVAAIAASFVIHRKIIFTRLYLNNFLNS